MRKSLEITGLWLILGALAALAPAYAQQTQARPAMASFQVSGYAVEGRVLLASQDFTRIVSPYVGRGRTIADLEQARLALENTYHHLGHCTVRVVLVQPEPRDGMVTFRVTEIPAREVRDCFPVAVLDKADRANPPVRPAAVYSYAEPRVPVSAAVEARSAPAVTPATASAGLQLPQAKAAAASAPPALTSSTREHAAETRLPAEAPVAATGEPAKSWLAGLENSLLAEAKNLLSGGLPFGGTVVPAAVVAQADPVKPAPAKAAPATAPEPLEPQAGPRFDITRYSVEGNTLLKPERIERVLAPFAGRDKDFGDVQRALEALSLAYQREGYGSVEIRLPEQELDKGEVKLRVVEPRIANITVEKNEHFNDANVRRSVPALREGETPNSRDIGKNVRLANENPAKQTAVLLRASEKEDHLDATIRVTDIDPKRYSISLDNTGNEETHRERLGLAFQHANLWNRDHILTLQFITSPLNYHDVLVYGAGYRIPLYSLGDSIDLVAGYSNVDSGTVQDLFVVSGKGTVFAFRYNQNLPRWGDLEHKLTYGLDYRAYQNNVTPPGSDFKLVPDITVHPLSVTYSGAWRAEGKGEFSYYLSMFQNIPGGSDGRDEDFKQVGARFPDGTAGYRFFRTGATYARPFGPDWQMRVRADGQYTDDALVSPEMFAIGGADSVRGFNERYTSNDKGYRTSWELYTPDLAKPAGFDGRLRFLAFYDQGVVRRNNAQPGELVQASLDSGGLGLRLNYKTALTLRLDVAYVFHDGTSTNGKDGQTKAHFSMAWVW